MCDKGIPSIPLEATMEKGGDENRDKALRLLQSLIKQKTNPSGRVTRSIELLFDYQTRDYSEGWYFSVPKALQSILDIKLTERTKDKITKIVWTQGSEFSFSEGHCLYDSHLNYEQWSKDLNQFKVLLQVRNGSPAIPGNDRDSGKVRFEVWKPNENNSGFEKLGEKKLTQDEFVKLLIEGPIIKWEDYLADK